MDRIDITGKIRELFSKYKHVLLILCAGIILMQLPERVITEPQSIAISETPESPATRADELEEILSQIDGVGKVKVLLTEADSAQTVYQTNEDINRSSDSENRRVETVVVTNSNREEAGLVRSITPPVYLGAIIVCQGGDIPTIQFSIVQAVSNVTGITSDRITVLKMK